MWLLFPLPGDQCAGVIHLHETTSDEGKEKTRGKAKSEEGNEDRAARRSCLEVGLFLQKRWPWMNNLFDFLCKGEA